MGGAGGPAGFTLLEMLVAISISGIILAASYGTFATANRTTRTIDAHEARVQNLRHACAALQQDLRCAVPPAPDGTRRTRWSTNGCRFVTWHGDRGRVLVRYAMEKDELVRTAEPLDVGAEGERQTSTTAAVARGVRDARFAYCCADSWQERLRPKQWPQAVRLQLNLAKGSGRQGRAYTQVIRVEAQ